MAARYVVFFGIALLVMGSAHYYVWARLVRDTGLSAPWARVLGIAIAFLFVLLMASFFVVRAFALSRAVAAPLMWIAYTWLGVAFFLVISLGGVEIVKAVSTWSSGATPDDPERRRAISRLFGGVAAALGFGASAAAVAGALSPVAVKRVRVVIDRLSKAQSGYRIVQISDVHIGPTIGRDFIEAVVTRINAQKPDLVAITGDLVDGSVEELERHVAPLGKIAARDGVFFVTGNHEYYSGADSWILHLRSLGIRVLRNEHVRIGGNEGFDLVGVDDASAHGFAPGHGSDLRKAVAGRDEARASVLLAHQPRGIDLADTLGIDLQLSGHTHGGQMFPWNLLVRLQQPFVAGLHRLSKAQIYVSRGTGYWGPPMRLGAPAEITEIELVST